MRKVVLLAAALVVVLGTMASSATSASSENGITARTITIGGTFPLTGRASVYAPIPAAMKAYFSYINSRKGPDGRRGVFGRQIVFKIYDDGYNPANTVQQTRKLVEEDKVFAVVGSLGTEHNEAIRPYLNQGKVPQLLNATGASTWARDAKQYPWTGGWQPDYEWEGRIYGTAIARNSPNAKIAVLYQNDSFGADNLRGFRAGLGAKASNIVGLESYELGAVDVRQQMAKLRATGATILVIFAIPTYAIPAYPIANALRWSPAVIYTSSVAATDTFLTLSRSSGGGDLVDKTFTVQYLKDPASPTWDNDAAMKLYKQVMAKYRPGGRVTDGLNYYGVAVAHAFVQLMYKAGRNPTRAALMRAFRNWDETNPFLLPGNRQRTSGNDQQAVACERIVKFTNGTFTTVSKLKCPGAAA
ncbi:MAG TPA: ABC transporter substrate-binding protein [Gaiella sp.]|jgi:branched-chain amino acid transport system substrate-binding protein|uniref:ABC transporter substrate-binding protein n=1 Tax=Gaiella sp. TaxID=2663207 RepID=UPI002D806579|nr:ABC transporter substrate-binding protein [Gaiella sp.]HET9286782.1 ABC transporter substrate-binding protein [Gaiella sp.]